jgi:hypothetical protein
MEENEDNDDNEEDIFAEREDVFNGEMPTDDALANGQTFSLPPNEQKNKLPESLSMLAMPLPLVAAGHSLAPDMQFGWKP